MMLELCLKEHGAFSTVSYFLGAEVFQHSVSQTFLFHRPLFTLDTSFLPPKPDKQTQGSKFKEFYLKKV